MRRVVCGMQVSLGLWMHWTWVRGHSTPGKQKSGNLLSTYWPPKSCIPKRAKTTMNRKRRNNRLMIDFMELRRETTRFLRDAQYFVTLKIRNNLRARNTLIPKDVPGFMTAQMTSKMLPMIT